MLIYSWFRTHQIGLALHPVLDTTQSGGLARLDKYPRSMQGKQASGSVRSGSDDSAQRPVGRSLKRGTLDGPYRGRLCRAPLLEPSRRELRPNAA